ncbi:MAG: polymer-forming cytoskeletal protein [Clostridiales bacterium]|jgi:cytoskeletal protein CcmA (bactofilin family)|nr:polymer-forming cytoskeletal protein [Clostridiales bacterium]
MLGIFQQKRPRYGEDPNFVPNTVIGEGLTMMGGALKGINSVMVSGLVFGDINVDGEVIVTETGYVKGNIISTFAVIAGIVEGNLQLSSYASLKSTASVTGDISCTAISIEDGAVFNGVNTMIAKSGTLNKKLKKINETAVTMMDGSSKLLGTADLPAEGYTVPEPEYAEASDEAEAAETPEPPEDDSGWHDLNYELEEEDDAGLEAVAEEETETEPEAEAEGLPEAYDEDLSEEEEPEGEAEEEEDAEDIE